MRKLLMQDALNAAHALQNALDCLDEACGTGQRFAEGAYTILERRIEECATHPALASITRTKLK